MPEYDHRTGQRGTNDGTAMFILFLLLLLLLGGGYYYYTLIVRRQEMALRDAQHAEQKERKLVEQQQAEAERKLAEVKAGAQEEHGQGDAAPDDADEPETSGTEDTVKPADPTPPLEE